MASTGNNKEKINIHLNKIISTFENLTQILINCEETNEFYEELFISINKIYKEIQDIIKLILTNRISDIKQNVNNCSEETNNCEKILIKLKDNKYMCFKDYNKYSKEVSLINSECNEIHKLLI